MFETLNKTLNNFQRDFFSFVSSSVTLNVRTRTIMTTTAATTIPSFQSRCRPCFCSSSFIKKKKRLNATTTASFSLSSRRRVLSSRGGAKNHRAFDVFVGASLTNDEEKEDNNNNSNNDDTFSLDDEGELSDALESEFENPGFEVFKDYDVASDEEEMRFQRTLMILEKYHLEFALFLPKSTNIGMYVYTQIREMSEYNRGRLLWSMTSRGIENAWLISGEGYKLSAIERDAVAGRRMTARGDIEEALEEYGFVDEDEDDGRDEEEEESVDEDEYNLEYDEKDKKYNAVVYEGRAANVPSKWLNRFQKVFYKAPRDARFAKDDPYQPVTFRGRVPLRGLGKHVLRDKLPLYFSTSDANISSDRMKIENTMEYVDPLALHYSAEYLKFRAPGEVSDLTGKMDTRERKTSLPMKWPPVVANFFPFDILTDYVRPLGPGVLVGNGFRGDSQTTFLKFLLVRGDYLDAERNGPKLIKLEK